MQVDPIKSKLKAPGTKRLKRNCDEPSSNFAFKLNLRRYIVVTKWADAEDAAVPADAPRQGGLRVGSFNNVPTLGWNLECVLVTRLTRP